jgi:hypothetical protein
VGPGVAVSEQGEGRVGGAGGVEMQGGGEPDWWVWLLVSGGWL